MTISWCAGSVAALILAANAVADPVILYDSGRSWPIDRFLEPLLSDGQTRDKRQSVPTRPLPGPPTLETLLPIRSAGLTPGLVTPREFATPVPVSFFMLGADSLSLRWLATHRDYLKEQGAVGLLVDATDEADLAAVAEVAEGISITPASGDDIAAVLEVRHYPMALTEGRIWQ